MRYELRSTPEDTARRAARAAGVTIRSLSALAELTAACELSARVWRSAPQDSPLAPTLLRAIVKAGGYVVGAYDADELVGVAVGFAGAPSADSLHSHVVGVVDRMRGHHVGFALKTHQRAWTLRHGASAISWTFDPLVRRNAHFNIGKLGALPVEYLPDFYGSIADGINRGDETDRVLVHWDLLAPEVIAACDGAGRRRTPDLTNATVALGISATGEPVVDYSAGPELLVAVPADVERLRTENPPLARRWRVAVRDTLTAQLAQGARIIGFHAGSYVLTKEDG